MLYLPEAARFSRLLAQPEGADIGQAINDAMRAIEAENEALRDVLPKTYNRLDNRTLFALLKNFNSVPMDIEGDAFGKIYEYFLGKFAMSEGQKGGEFFTPTSIVKLIVEIIEPFGGRIFDPACGSGGMFVQSARFVAEHRRSATGGANGEPGRTLSIFGQEKVAETVRLCRMNLAVNGLEGDIDQGNSYYEDPHNARAKFDFVMANPPFNVDKVDKERLADDPALPLRPAQARQRQLPVDPAFLQQPERDRPGRLRDGELRGQRARLRAGDPPQADRGRRGGRDGRGRLELLLHGDAAVYAVVLRSGERRP